MRLALQNKASMDGTQSQVFRSRGHSVTKHITVTSQHFQTKTTYSAFTNVGTLDNNQYDER